MMIIAQRTQTTVVINNMQKINILHKCICWLHEFKKDSKNLTQYLNMAYTAATTVSIEKIPERIYIKERYSLLSWQEERGNRAFRLRSLENLYIR
jgi:hypothetical protein